MSGSDRFKAFFVALLFYASALPLLAHAGPDPVAEGLKAEEQQIGVTDFTASSYKKGTVRHVVMIRFKQGIPQTQQQKIVQAFLALQKSSQRNGSPYIQAIETGPQISGEGASHGLQQAFIVTFASEGDRNYFIGTPIVTDPQHYEPAHEAFKKILKPALARDGLVSFDFPVVQTAH